MLIVPKDSPALWSLVNSMDGEQRALFVRELLSSVSAFTVDEPYLSEAVERYLRASAPSVTELERFADRMDDLAAGDCRGEPEHRWIGAFRKARCAHALIGLLQHGTSDIGMDCCIYELANVHWPDYECALANAVRIAERITGNPERTRKR